MAEVKKYIVAHRGYAWQLFNKEATPTRAACTTYMQGMCHPKSPAIDGAMYYRFSDPPNMPLDLATFLLVRGSYAWLGYSWDGCTGAGKAPPYMQYGLPDEVKIDYGEPIQGLKLHILNHEPAAVP